MSDGATDGARQVRAFQERQGKINQLFTLIADHVTQDEASPGAMATAFDIFDQARFVGYDSSESLRRGLGERLETFLGWMKLTRAALFSAFPDRNIEIERAWAEILTLGLLYASPEVVDRLHQASLYRDFKIALFVPKGSATHSTRLHGDLEAVLDHVTEHDHERIRVIRINHGDPIDRERSTKLLFVCV